MIFVLMLRGVNSHSTFSGHGTDAAAVGPVVVADSMYFLTVSEALG